ncbi:hypothetical protein GW17_00049394 [Ensete ventricosum]|nr:hypothetical protein GW17_00049394 [Ensete ventricosum]RZS27159.1 hypothetical protein BHM03_00060593 [Ensete ventricosum]
MSRSQSNFKQQHEFEKRKTESKRIEEKYPGRFPVIVEKADRSDVSNTDKKKYLVPGEITFGQFVHFISKRINMSGDKAIFMFVDNALPQTGILMSQLYDDAKDEDGFLYFVYGVENTFGCQNMQ